MIAGARVAPDRSGGGRPPLIFVHGVGSTAAIWDYQLDPFSEYVRCAAIELRGNGSQKPDPDPSSITREGFADDVLAVADALGAERFTIVGCSLGGVVAFELWRRVPRRIAGMVLLGTFARYPDGEANARQISAAVLEAGDMRAFGRMRAEKLGMPPDRMRETVEQMACKSVDCYLASTQATWTGDYRDVLPAIDVPALVAYGEHDVVAPRSLAQEIVSGIKGARLEMVEAAGHVANADNPEAFNRLLREYLETTS